MISFIKQVDRLIHSFYALLQQSRQTPKAWCPHTFPPPSHLWTTNPVPPSPPTHTHCSSIHKSFNPGYAVPHESNKLCMLQTGIEVLKRIKTILSTL